MDILKWTFTLSVIFLLAVNNCYGQSVDENAVQLVVKKPLLIASPDVCELSKDVYLCEMNAALIWEASTVGHYCIYEQGVKSPIKCWNRAWSGSHVLQFKSNKSVIYILKNIDYEDVIIQAEINVIGTLEQRIRAKRRRRFFRIF